MRLSFESHIPKNVVDQMNDILVQDIHLLDDSALRRVSDIMANSQLKQHQAVKQALPTCPLEHPSDCRETFHRLGAKLACQST